jgi:hypothetical protein
MSSLFFTPGSTKVAKSRAEVGSADGNGRYSMRKAFPTLGPQANQKVPGNSVERNSFVKGTNTNSEALMGNEPSWSNPKDGRGF